MKFLCLRILYLGNNNRVFPCLGGLPFLFCGVPPFHDGFLINSEFFRTSILRSVRMGRPPIIHEMELVFPAITLPPRHTVSCATGITDCPDIEQMLLLPASFPCSIPLHRNTSDCPDVVDRKGTVILIEGGSCIVRILNGEPVLRVRGMRESVHHVHE